MKFLTILIYFLLPLSLALAEDLTPLIDRLELIEKNVSSLQKQYYSKNNTASKNPASNNTHYETRIAGLEEQMREMRGEIEQLSHASKSNAVKLDKLAEDIEFRFKELGDNPKNSKATKVMPEKRLEKKSSDPLDEVIDEDNVLQSFDEDSNQDNFEEQTTPSKPKSLIPETTGSLGTVKVDLVNQELLAAKKVALDNKNKAAIKEKAEETNKAKSQAEFDLAFDSFRQSKFKEAQEQFKQFITKNANSKLTGSAYYWLGESFLQTATYDKAALNFIQGYKKFPTGSKAPNSLLKLAITLNKMGKKPESCKMFAQFEEQFSSTASANLLQKAREEASKVSCK